MKVSNVRQLLKRGWYFSELPGYRSHPSKFRTYSLFPYDELPAIEEELTDFSWLLRDHMKDQSLLDGMYPDGSKPDLSKLAELQNSINISFPSSFIDFINSDDNNRLTGGILRIAARFFHRKVSHKLSTGILCVLLDTFRTRVIP